MSYYRLSQDWRNNDLFEMVTVNDAAAGLWIAVLKNHMVQFFLCSPSSIGKMGVTRVRVYNHEWRNIISYKHGYDIYIYTYTHSDLVARNGAEDAYEDEVDFVIFSVIRYEITRSFVLRVREESCWWRHVPRIWAWHSTLWPDKFDVCFPCFSFHFPFLTSLEVSPYLVFPDMRCHWS